MSPGSLRRRLVLGILGYLVLLSVALVIQGHVVNEQAEQVVWRSLLDIEMDQALLRRGRDPVTPSASTALRLFDGGPSAPLPRAVQGLPPGLHDDVLVDGREHVVLVRDVGARRHALVLDIAEFEADEAEINASIVVSAIAVIVLFALALTWSVGRMLRPLDALAAHIATLRPDVVGGHLVPEPSATRELIVIADALNGYLDRQAQFVERERAFAHTASHELRTPIAVIAGAAQVGLDQRDLPPLVREQLQRIHRTTGEVDALLGLLLVLAREPARIARAATDIDLPALLAGIADDHRHLLRGRDLDLRVHASSDASLHAPAPIVQSAIGNLLRNAIEHSDRGVIDLHLQHPATVLIDDPGHGMSPEEISALFTRLARGEGHAHESSGIGLELIARLCEHLGWTLAFETSPNGGTRTRLALR